MSRVINISQDDFVTEGVKPSSLLKIPAIYKFTNKINEKVYIGKTINLRRRIESHVHEVYLKRGNTYLHKSFRKYGIENFTLEILKSGESINNQDLIDMEIDFIKLYNSNDRRFGYNLTQGGEGVTGFIVSDETRKKMSEIQKGRPSKNKGRKHTEEARKKMSERAKGKVHTEEYKKNMSESCKGINKGAYRSPEVRKKISDSLKQRHVEKIIREYMEKKNVKSN